MSHRELAPRRGVRTALRLLLAARDPDLIDLGTDYGLRQVREALGRLASSRGAVDPDEWSRLAPEAIVHSLAHHPH